MQGFAYALVTTTRHSARQRDDGLRVHVTRHLVERQHVGVGGRRLVMWILQASTRIATCYISQYYIKLVAIGDCQRVQGRITLLLSQCNHENTSATTVLRTA